MYDKAKDNDDGSKELILPGWNQSDYYTIKVETQGGGNTDRRQPYLQNAHYRKKDTKNRCKMTKNDRGGKYEILSI